MKAGQTKVHILPARRDVPMSTADFPPEVRKEIADILAAVILRRIKAAEKSKEREEAS